ncbi:MAG: hypothetical protein KAH44_13150, partial [Oricola sp.]|nr:hypothetical protein [Oricola sp.]
WPAEPVIARAYMDQLARSETLSEGQMKDLAAALDSAEAALEKGGADKAVSDKLKSLAAGLKAAGDDAAKKRIAGLSETLNGISARLR